MSIQDAIRELEGQETNVRFQRLLIIAENFFGKPRISGSHHIFKMPWAGDPRMNLQKVSGKAKPYQVRQVVQCLKRLSGGK